MLEAAKLQPGDQVLDIAAGTGDQSRQAARLVRPEGSVLATDISQEMLDVAARLAQQEGLSNMTTASVPFIVWAAAISSPPVLPVVRIVVQIEALSQHLLSSDRRPR
jgi:protein-L-isoaspartate O-methyltransferase